MRCDRWGAVAAMVMAGLSPAWGAGTGVPAPATGPGASAELTRLVEKLGAGAFAEREAAQKRLVEMGPGVVPAIEALLPAVKDPEIQTRLERAIDQIRIEDMQHPTALTLHKTALPAEILAEVARQANIEIVANWDTKFSDLKTPITVQVEQEAFWPAFLDICQQCQLRLVKTGGPRDRTITLQWYQSGAAGGVLRPAPKPSSQGCFYIVPEPPHSSMPGDMDLQFSVYVDPKLEVTRMTSWIDCAEATDGRGNSLLRQPPTFSPEDFGKYYGWQRRVTANMRPPDDNVVASFKGTFRVQVLEKTEKWVIDRPLEGTGGPREMPFGKVSVGIAQDDPRTVWAYDTYKVGVHFTIQRGMETRVVGGKTPKAANRGDTSFLLDGFGGTIRVSDAAGNVSEPVFISLGYVTLQGETSGGDSIAGHTRENKNLGPVRHLIYEIPVQVREVTVPLEYKNIDTKRR